MPFSHFKSFDGTQIAWTQYGSGSPTLVLCDGIGCDGFAWRYFTPQFSKRHRIVHWHYPGHGESSLPPDYERVAIADLAKHLAHMLVAARVEPPFALVGHSMGVQVIFEYAVRHPSQVAGLVPICGSYGHVLDTFHGNGVLKWLHPRLLRFVDAFPRVANALWRAAGASPALAFRVACLTELNGDLLQRADFDPYVEHMRTLDLTLFARMLGLAAEHTVETALSALDTPTLIIAAEHDSFTPLWLSERMHALLPHSRLIRLRLGSHAAPIELPDHMNLAVEEFLTTLAPTREEERREGGEDERAGSRSGSDANGGTTTGDGAATRGSRARGTLAGRRRSSSRST